MREGLRGRQKGTGLRENRNLDSPTKNHGTAESDLKDHLLQAFWQSTGQEQEALLTPSIQENSPGEGGNMLGPSQEAAVALD